MREREPLQEIFPLQGNKFRDRAATAPCSQAGASATHPNDLVVCEAQGLVHRHGSGTLRTRVAHRIANRLLTTRFQGGYAPPSTHLCLRHALTAPCICACHFVQSLLQLPVLETAAELDGRAHGSGRPFGGIHAGGAPYRAYSGDNRFDLSVLHINNHNL